MRNKRTLLYGVSIALFIIAAATSSSVRAQQDEPIAGGYAAASVTDKDVKSAAAFAIKSRIKKTGKTISLIKMEKAEMQIVAGRNYRLCMRVKDSAGRKSTVTAVVYRDLSNRRSLSLWKSGGCSEL